MSKINYFNLKYLLSITYNKFNIMPEFKIYPKKHNINYNIKNNLLFNYSSNFQSPPFQ
jgi:hypothetical protein